TCALRAGSSADPSSSRFASSEDRNPRGLASSPGSPERPPLFLRQAAPHAGVLTGGHGPFEALHPDLALHADGFRRRDLRGGRSGGADGEKELRILVSAASAVNPVQSEPPFARSGHDIRQSRPLCDARPRFGSPTKASGRETRIILSRFPRTQWPYRRLTDNSGPQSSRIAARRQRIPKTRWLRSLPQLLRGPTWSSSTSVSRPMASPWSCTTSTCPGPPTARDRCI